jgi:hypothetical protein
VHAEHKTVEKMAESPDEMVILIDSFLPLG